MKLTTFLLIVTLFNVNASNYAQNTKITLNLEDVSIEKVLKEIELITEFKFLFNRKDIDVSKTVSIKADKKSVKIILNKMFLDNLVFYELLGKQIILKPVLRIEPKITSIEVEQKTIKGTVVDETGQPLPGASVVVKGSTSGTTTDFDGNFSLNIIENTATLVVSYVGFVSQEVAINSQSVVHVKMKPSAASLEEIVIVGYGKQRKIDVTGSVSSISSEEISRAPTSNLANSLSGKLTGVIATQRSGQPGFDNPTFLIRGQSTFGNNSPLILVDGIVRSFSRVNPNEIATVTVLKDAASTAVFGARAANGVILITTKRGVSGQASFDYTTSYSWQKPTMRPEYMNSGEFAKYINIARANSGDNPKYTPEEVTAFENGTAPNTDWWAETTSGSAITEQHNFSVNGGTEKTKYFLSFGYLNQDGLLKSSNFNTYNIRSNIDTQLTESLKFSVDLAGRKETRYQSAVGTTSVLQRIDQSLPTHAAYFDEIEKGALGWNGLNGSPIGDSDFSGTDKRVNNIFQSNFELTYDFKKIKGLSASGKYSFDYTAGANKNFLIPHNYYLSATAPPSPSRTNIELTERRTQYSQETMQFRLNYLTEWQLHKLSVLALVEQTETNTDNISAYRDGFISPSINQLFAGSPDKINNNGSANVSARRGYVGRLNYSYDDKYMFQVNARYDGSFNFPSNKRWGLFPALSAGWVVSKENFLKDSELVNNLKLRVSWGQVGNDRIPQYQYLSGFQFNSGYVVGGSYQAGIFDPRPANPLITWETATTTNIGFEYGLFNGMLTGEVDYFRKRTKDILRGNTAATPGTFGSNLPDENFAVVDNQGVEFVIKHTKRLGEFKYSFGFNGTYATSEIIDIREPIGVEDRIRRTGRPFGQQYGYTAIGLFQSQAEIDGWAIQDGNSNNSLQPGDIKYKDINEDGKVDGFDISHIGKSETPEFIYGFNTAVEYKGFELNVFFQGATGFQREVIAQPFELETNSERVLIDSWSPTNTNAEYPRLSVGSTTNNQNRKSTFWLKDASYLRLKNIELAYSLPEIQAVKDLGITNLRLYVSGSNLLTFSKIKNRDPEGPSGIRGSFYPQTKSYLLGLSVKF